MLNPFKLYRRFTCLALLLMGGGTVMLFVMIAVVVVATDGLGSGDLVQVPEIPEGQLPPGAPEPEVRLNSVIITRPLMQDIPLPADVSRDEDVIATNAGLAILLALLFGIITTTLNNLLREEEDTLRRWFSIPLITPLFRLLDWGTDRSVRRGCLTLPLIAAVFALYGIIFAFLEDGLKLLEPEGMQLALVMAMSVGLISLSGDVAQRQVSRLWRRTSRYGLYPANLFLAVLTTIGSRTFHLTPGIAFGVPGGVDIDMEGETRFREVVLAFTTLVVLVVLGAGGWAAAAAFNNFGDRSMSLDDADSVAPLLQLGLTIMLAIFFVAVETGFFEMVPLTATLGGQIFRWNPLVWGLAFAPVAFVFNHTLLNPGGEYLETFEQANVQMLTAVIVILGAITAALWFHLRVLHRKPAHPPVPRPGQYAAPPQAAYRQPSRPSSSPRSAQPPVAPPPSISPPTMMRRTPPPPPRDQVPPPIVIRDEPPPTGSLDKTLPAFRAPSAPPRTAPTAHPGMPDPQKTRPRMPPLGSQDRTIARLELPDDVPPGDTPEENDETYILDDET